MAKKQAIGRSLSNTDIAAAVERATGKDTSRQLVEHWFRGIREPYMSQFIALCERLELDPKQVITASTAASKPVFRSDEARGRTGNLHKKIRRRIAG